MLKATPRSCVEVIDFRTTTGYSDTTSQASREGRSPSRRAAGRRLLRSQGPSAVINDFGVLTPAPKTRELQLSAMFDDVRIEQARAAFGWPLRIAELPESIVPPSRSELEALRALEARTNAAHARGVSIPEPIHSFPHPGPS
jgi:glutaconate CoA-transferase subunit B